jgi:DNA-binding IclR family transcriptional regulator
MSTIRPSAPDRKRSRTAPGTAAAPAETSAPARTAAPAAESTAAPAEPARTSAVGVLDRSVALLELLADGPRPLRPLAEASGVPRPTAHRLLVALEAHGLVARTADGAFRLGPRLAELAARADPGLDLGAAAGRVLSELHDATGESAQLYVRSGDRRMCVAARDAGTGLRDSVPVGALLPLDAGSGGKVLLAWSADADRFPAVTAAELAAVRRRGWAASVAEREPGVASVSAPVLADGRLLGAVCVSGPTSRVGQAPGRLLAPAVTAAARELAALSGTKDHPQHSQR